MSRDLTQRLTALSRAHDLALPALSEQKKAVPLGDLLGVLLAPYVEKAIGHRVRVSVPDWLVGDSSVTTLALVVHELATNSIKYGALSNAVGTLDVSGIAQENELVITWTERGGPPIVHSKGPAGFGTQLIVRSISSQLGGTIAFDWQREGVIVALSMNKARLGV
jgi:two-component sensor histidine kinase